MQSKFRFREFFWGKEEKRVAVNSVLAYNEYASKEKRQQKRIERNSVFQTKFRSVGSYSAFCLGVKSPKQLRRYCDRVRHDGSDSCFFRLNVNCWGKGKITEANKK